MMKQAAVYKVKYGIEKRTLPLGFMGVHMDNRGRNKNIFPNAEDVRRLGISIWRMGFNKDIANFDGVAVEEIPGEERAKLEREKAEEIRRIKAEKLKEKKKDSANWKRHANGLVSNLNYWDNLDSIRSLPVLGKTTKHTGCLW